MAAGSIMDSLADGDELIEGADDADSLLVLAPPVEPPEQALRAKTDATTRARPPVIFLVLSMIPPNFGARGSGCCRTNPGAGVWHTVEAVYRLFGTGAETD